MTQSALNGQVTLSNNDGLITFEQLPLAPREPMRLVNNQGAIDATLPQNAAFHVNAATNSGSITSDYAGVQVQNKQISADVGNPPRAVVSLSNNSGSIALHMQKGA